jgi:AcrR family transcriptional regulator
MNKVSEVLAKRQETERKERKDRILTAARKVFLNKGYLGATIRDIALEAELSPGLIYHYFDNKDDVYGQICEEAFHILLKTLKKADSDGKPVLVRLEELARAYVSFYTDYPEYFEIISFKELGFKQVGLTGEIGNRLNQLSLNALSVLEEIVTEGMADGKIPAYGNSREITLSFWASIEGIIFIHKRGYLEMFDLSIKQVLDCQIPIILDGIVKK